MSGKFIGINKFCEAVKELTNNVSVIGIYFTEAIKSKLYDNQVSIKPIGYTLTTVEGEVKFLRYYDVRKILPETDFIKFTENKNRRIDEQNKLYRLMIQVDELEVNDYKYHKSKIIKSNDMLKNKLISALMEDKKRLYDEQSEMIEDDFNICEIEPDFI